MIDPAHGFARATFDLLMIVHDRQLPAPMALRWSQYTQQLDVQVYPGDFLRYLDNLTEAARTTVQRDGRTHYRAAGALRGAPQTVVSLSAVTALRAVA